MAVVLNESIVTFMSMDVSARDSDEAEPRVWVLPASCARVVHSHGRGRVAFSRRAYIHGCD